MEYEPFIEVTVGTMSLLQLLELAQSKTRDPRGGPDLYAVLKDITDEAHLAFRLGPIEVSPSMASTKLVKVTPRQLGFRDWPKWRPGLTNMVGVAEAHTGLRVCTFEEAVLAAFSCTSAYHTAPFLYEYRNHDRFIRESESDSVCAYPLPILMSGDAEGVRMLSVLMKPGHKRQVELEHEQPAYDTLEYSNCRTLDTPVIFAIRE